MALDVRTLEEFYDGRIGQVARRLILRRLRARWPNLSGQRILGLGYAGPYLRPMVGEAERTIVAIPEVLGVASWCVGDRNLAALVDELALPFADSFFDCLLVIHGLEATEAQRPFLRELWRVLAPAGRLIVVAPNRASLWAQMETSPFGHGQPYSRGQLGRLLDESLFRPEHWDAALFMPPFGSRRSAGGGQAWERVGRKVWPGLAGVHIVEATKSLYAPVALTKARRRGVLKPALATNVPSKITPSKP